MDKKLYRNRHEGALSGVCAGLGEYLRVDKTWIRLAFVVSVIFSSMLGLGMLGPIVYIVLWIVVPVKPHTVSEFDPVADQPVADPQGYYDSQYDVDYRVGATSTFASKREKSNQDRYIAGLILLIIGVFFLLHQLNVLFVHDVIRYWPVLLILSGIVVLFGAFRRQEDPTSFDSNENPSATLSQEEDTLEHMTEPAPENNIENTKTEENE